MAGHTISRREAIFVRHNSTECLADAENALEMDLPHDQQT
jgi:hypothetical protein